MKLILTTAAAAIAFAMPSAALAAPGGAGATSTIQGTASAEVVAPIQIECPGPMNWGKLAPQHFATTISMDTDGSPLNDPSNISVPGARNIASPGHCDVTGEAGLSYTVTVPTSETLTKVGGGATMTMTNFTISADDFAPPYDEFNRTLANVGGVGKSGFDVGATLHVGADQEPGVYEGFYTVSVQYN